MKVPQHIAIILDGNGRWAKAKGMPRNYGHAQGSKNVERICEEAWRMGIKYLTVYAFSTENWNRPDSEVAALMKLLRNYMNFISVEDAAEAAGISTSMLNRLFRKHLLRKLKDKGRIHVLVQILAQRVITPLHLRRVKVVIPSVHEQVVSSVSERPYGKSRL